MKIVICGSINFTPKIKEISDKLLALGHEVDIPLTSQRIINGELTIEEFEKEKEKNGDSVFRESAMRKIKEDVIKRYYKKIKEADSILVVNLEKKGLKDYIGGNTFLEMGFAHVLNKKIYLYNNIPESSFKDEIVAMQPVVLGGDVKKYDL
jgi:nucleoside 2-deoxyribosyltransferase